MDNQIEELQRIVSHGRHLVFFGGAGLSTESGIPDFRSNTGLYARKFMYPAEMMLSHSFFIAHREEFFEFYRTCMVFPDAKPNKAHEKLAALELAGKLSAVITQNIDGLHQKAGSKTVLELHGSIHRNTCMGCGKSYSLAYMMEARPLPLCTCGQLIKPDVVLYEESLDDMVLAMAADYIGKADVLIIGGTSLAVYPAAGLLDFFEGQTLVVINKSPTSRDKEADLVINGSIAQVLGQLE